MEFIVVAFAALGLGIAGCLIYLVLVYAFAAAAVQWRDKTAPDVFELTSLIERVLSGQNISAQEWAGARWRVADPHIDQLLRLAWNKVGQWCRGGPQLQDEAQRKRAKEELRHHLEQIYKVVGPVKRTARV